MIWGDKKEITSLFSLQYLWGMEEKQTVPFPWLNPTV